VTEQCSLNAEQIPTTDFVTARHRPETLAPQNGIPRLTEKILLNWNGSFAYDAAQRVLSIVKCC